MFLASSGGHASGHSSAHVSVAEPAAHVAPAPRAAAAPAEPVFVPRSKSTPIVHPATFAHPRTIHLRDCTEAEKKDKRHHCK